MTDDLERLRRGRAERLAVAVSGGVDSLTLAWVAGALPGLSLTAVHATSPAVLPEASHRVRRHAAAAGWDLHILNAGEYTDPDYRRNPINRYFYCKKNLYGRIREIIDAAIASGTNLDDLGDYRLGLIAAETADVWHPYVGPESANRHCAVSQRRSAWTISRICRRSPAWPAVSKTAS